MIDCRHEAGANDGILGGYNEQTNWTARHEFGGMMMIAQLCSSSLVQVYRALIEWAGVFSILRDKDFGTDTIIVSDRLLRSKVLCRRPVC